MQNRRVATTTVGPLAALKYTHRTMQAVVCALWVLATVPSAHAAASIFTPPPATFNDLSTSVAGVSTDGSVVVGASYNLDFGGYGGPPNACQALRWTAGTGSVGLGHLPGDLDSTATMVSGDGSVVVGVSALSFSSAGSVVIDLSAASFGSTVGQAFRWTAGSGMVGLGYLPGGTNDLPVAVSSNGSVIIGTSYSASGGQAFRWTAGSGMVGLGYLPGGTNSAACCLSADGSVIVGTNYSASGVQAFRWTAGTGMVGLGYLPGGTNSSPSGISADGSVIVGTSYSASGSQAFRWTAGSGMVGLGYLPGDTNSQASAISADGSVMVGTSSSPAGYRAFRWTAGLGMVALGTNNYCFPTGVSRDGSIILGSDGVGPFRWTVGSGMQDLYDFLATNGASPNNIGIPELGSAVISVDGNTIFGYGIDDPTEGDILYYVATVPGLIGVPPPLSISSSHSTAKQLVLSWPTNYTGCTLQSSSDLGSTNWTNCASPVVSGSYFAVTNPIPAGAQFFRLKR